MWINVPMGKGVILRLPLEEYRAALQRGKAWQRATRHAARMAAAKQRAAQHQGPQAPGREEKTS